MDLDDLSNNSLLVLDDLMMCNDLKSLCNFFIADSRHRCITPFFVLHNLFPKSSEARTISLNATHYVIFRNLRDRMQFSLFARQLTPNWKQLLDIYNDLSECPFSPLVIDLRQTTPSPLRFKSDILNKEHFVIYSTKDEIEKHATKIFKIEDQPAYIIDISQ